MRTPALLAALAAAALAKDSRTFAVLHFQGKGPLTMGRSDPIVSPGQASSHVHAVQGGNGFGNAATGATLLQSTCSTANILGDNSAYWMPSVYFRDPQNGSFEAVPLFYMNVYYFFEATNDAIQPFPVGLQMVSGNATRAAPPATGSDQLDPSKGPVQPAQFTCPRSSFDPPSYPPGSDGTRAGLPDTNNKGAGAGFPFAECDGYASPLRADLHFPSCYDPSQPLDAYKTNTAFPSDAGGGKQDCPAGWVHLPHLFYEMYWNTPLFADRWTPNQGSQPFVLSNGDAAGYSLHGDFMAAWDTDVLQTIIDSCDAGDAGMDKCPGIQRRPDGDCSVPNPTPEQIDGVLAALPGHNPLFGWAYGAGGAGGTSNAAAGSSAASSAAALTTSTTSPTKAASTKAAETAGTVSETTSVEAVAASAPATSPTTSTTSPTTTSTAKAVVPSVPLEKAVVSTSSAASSASSTTSTTSASTAPPSVPAASSPAASSPTHAGHACKPPSEVHTTVVTSTVTVHSTSTSTIYQTRSATATATALHRRAHKRF